jgi:hypothetical protein
MGASQVLSNEQGTIPQPGGLADISRGLSEATPPIHGQNLPAPRQGCQTVLRGMLRPFQGRGVWELLPGVSSLRASTPG